eukprot:1158629-Pelagomonas_calceolata.AAC.1
MILPQCFRSAALIGGYCDHKKRREEKCNVTVNTLQAFWPGVGPHHDGCAPQESEETLPTSSKEKGTHRLQDKVRTQTSRWHQSKATLRHKHTAENLVTNGPATSNTPPDFPLPKEAMICNS